jgi:hypothetical protein
MNTKNLFNPEALPVLIDEAELTYQQVADEVGCGLSTLYKWIKGDTVPRYKQLKKLVVLLGPQVTRLKVGSLNQSEVYLSLDEKRVVRWFAARTRTEQDKLIGCLAVIREFGPDVDVEFAAELGAGLLTVELRSKEQPG